MSLQDETPSAVAPHSPEPKSSADGLTCLTAPVTRTIPAGFKYSLYSVSYEWGPIWSGTTITLTRQDEDEETAAAGSLRVHRDAVDRLQSRQYWEEIETDETRTEALSQFWNGLNTHKSKWLDLIGSPPKLRRFSKGKAPKEQVMGGISHTTSPSRRIHPELNLDH